MTENLAHLYYYEFLKNRIANEFNLIQLFIFTTTKKCKKLSLFLIVFILIFVVLSYY